MLLVFDTDGVKTRTPLSIVSSGFRTILAMVCDIMNGLLDPRIGDHEGDLVSAEAIVVIDEIEAHLHPRWKMQIMHGLREALPKVTFIVTTHDPLCLRGMMADEVVVMRRITRDQLSETDIPTQVEKLSTLPDTRNMTVEQLLTADFFQLNSTDAPETEIRLSSIADILVRQEQGAMLSETELESIKVFQSEITDSLPVGSTEVHRLVQEAVAEFLQQRRKKSHRELKELREETKRNIAIALGSMI